MEFKDNLKKELLNSVGKYDNETRLAILSFEKEAIEELIEEIKEGELND